MGSGVLAFGLTTSFGVQSVNTVGKSTTFWTIWQGQRVCDALFSSFGQKDGNNPTDKNKRERETDGC
jgi:hypothetical protein